MEAIHHDQLEQPEDATTAGGDKRVKKQQDSPLRITTTQRKWNVFLLLAAMFLLASTTSRPNDFLYVIKQLPPSKDGYIWLNYLMIGMWFCSTLIGGLLADNFLGRFQHLVGSIAVLSVIYFCMALGTIRLPGLGWIGLDVAAIMFCTLLMGNMYGSSTALIGDQTTSEHNRRFTFMILNLTDSLASIFVFLFSTAAEKNMCMGAEKCYFLPYIAGCILSLGIVLVLNIFKRQIVKQAACQWNLLPTLYMMLKYSILMRISVNGAQTKKSVFEYAEELDQETAMDLRRLSRNLFFVVIYVFYNCFLFTAVQFLVIQALDMNPYAELDDIENLSINQGTMFIAGSAILAYVYFFPKKFLIMGAIKATVFLITTASLTILALEGRIWFGCVNVPGDVQLGVINSLNCSVIVSNKENGDQHLILENQAEGFTNKLSHLKVSVDSKCFPDMANNLSLSESMLNASSDAAVITFHWHNHSINTAIYTVETSELRRKTLLIGNNPNLKITQGTTEIDRVNMSTLGRKSLLFRWYVKATGATNRLQVSSAESYVEWMINVGSTYFLIETLDKPGLIEIIPGCRPSRALQLIPRMIINFVTFLCHLSLQEFTYTQAPARLRALLFGVVLSAGSLSSMIVIGAEKVAQLRSDGKLINFSVASFLTVCAWVYASWKLDKIGLCQMEPAEDETED